MNRMTIEYILDDLHVALTRRWWTQMFTAFVRCLLALAFIPPSIPKILHQPFTVLPDSNPVGHYFNALMGTGFYYEFIGWSQLIAALLLLIPRTSHIGAFIFLPIIANVAVLTNAVGFAGTWLITLLMLFAGIYLAAWEWDRLKPLLVLTRRDRPQTLGRRLLLVPLFFAAGGAVMGLLWWMIRLGNFSNYLIVDAALIFIGFTFGIAVALHYRYMPVGHLERPNRLR
jgi:hypothetical protein